MDPELSVMESPNYRIVPELYYISPELYLPGRELILRGPEFYRIGPEFSKVLFWSSFGTLNFNFAVKNGCKIQK